MKLIKRYYTIPMWILIGTAIALYMHIKHRFHFPFVEQSQMFMFDGTYITEKLWQPAGVAILLEEFFTQFFALPLFGPIFVAVALVLTGILTRSIVLRIAPSASAPLLWLMPIALQLFTMVDYDYQYSGIISYIIALAAFRGYLAIDKFGYKITAAIISSLLLYWAAGPAAMMYAASVVVYEVFTAPRKAAFTLLLPLIVAAAGWVAVYYLHLTSEVRYALWPDLYYKPMIHPASDFYYAWIAIPVICAIATLLRHRSTPTATRRWIEVTLQVVCIAVIVNFAGQNKEFPQPAVSKFKEMDYYLREQQWDKILKLSEEQGVDNTMHILMQNIALIQTDALGEKAFGYTQAGLDGVTMDWSDNNPFIFSMLSDLHWALGNVSISQEVAFKKNGESIAINHSYNPRMLKRLVQTNITYGGESGYAIAEKYIALLEKSLFYKEWATEQRKWLNDNIPPLPLIEQQRLNMHNIDLTYKMAENYDILHDIKHCDLSRRTFEHLCVGCLLNLDLEGFYNILSRVYDTDTLPCLPQSFAEAILIYSTQNKSIQGKYPIDPTTQKRFLEFQDFVARNYNNKNLASIMRKSYSSTYWYYYMFTK